MRHTGAAVEVEVEFEDVDSFQIVHHSKLICYMERARLRLMKKLGLPLGPEGDTLPVMYDLSVRFQRPARLLDHLDVSVEVSDADDFHLELKYRVVRDGRLVARGTSIIAFMNPSRNESVPVPSELMERIDAEVRT